MGRLAQPRTMRGARGPRRTILTKPGPFNLAASMNAAATMSATLVQTQPLTASMNVAVTMAAPMTMTRVQVVAFTADELLDLAAPRRVETFRFDVIDQDSNTLGQLAVTGDTTPQISNDASRRIRRTLTGVTIPPRTDQTSASSLYFSDDIDVNQHRIKVWHVLGDGGPDYELPLGVFIFSDDPRTQATYGETITAALDDLSHIFDQPVVESFTWPAGTNVGAALASLYADAGLDCRIDPTIVALGEPVTQVALQDSRQKTADTFCAIAGFLPPYFDNTGTGICRATPDFTSTTPTLDYTDRADTDSVVHTSSMLVAPNVWIAEASSATDAAIVGRYELDASDPRSYASIGYWVPEKVDVQGIDTAAAADEAARAAGVASRKQLRRRHWTSPIDSRHDTFDPIAWGTEIDLEQSWSMDLVAGGTMTHESVVLA